MSDFYHLSTISMPSADGYVVIRPNTQYPHDINTPNINTLCIAVTYNADGYSVIDTITPYGSLDRVSYYAIESIDGYDSVDDTTGPLLFDTSKYAYVKLYAANINEYSAVTPSYVHVLGYTDTVQTENYSNLQAQITNNASNILANGIDIVSLDALITAYANTEDQRWIDSSQQRQDLRNAADAYGAFSTAQTSFNTDVLSDLDGYAVLPSSELRGDGYLTFFTGTTVIEGDSDLYWDQANSSLVLNGQLNLDDTTEENPMIRAQDRNLWVRTGNDGDFASFAAKQIDAYGDITLLDGYGDRHSLRPSFAEMFMVTPTAKALTANVWAKASGITGGGECMPDWDIGSANRITYTGASTRYTKIDISMSSFVSNATTQVYFAVYKNGDRIESSVIQRYHATATDVGAVSIHCLSEVVTDDYFELWVKASGNTNCTIKYMNISIQSI